MRTGRIAGAILAGLVALSLSVPAEARKSGSSGYRSPSYKSHSSSRASPGVPRDSHGKIKRSPRARAEFKRQHPCPSTGRPSGGCPGYVIDHVKPLEARRGG